MMINIIAKNHVKKDKIEEFKATAKPLIAASRAEAGCISYSLFEDVKDSSILTFIEEWESLEAITIHNNSSHFTSIVPLLAPLTEKPTDVNLYEKVGV
jgi:quinol monooxygenase YgiN